LSFKEDFFCLHFFLKKEKTVQRYVG